jgi:hypothetical protein
MSFVVTVYCRHTKYQSGYLRLVTLLERSRLNPLPFPVSLIVYGVLRTYGFIHSYQCFGPYVLEGWFLQNVGTCAQVPTKNPSVTFKKTEPHMSPVSMRKIN